MKRRYASAILLFLLLGINTNLVFAQESHDFEISKNLDIFTSLIQQLNLHYVDDIEPGTLTQTAIDAMLKHIDPYTVYYPESEIEDVRYMQTGQYGGIGSFMHIKNGQIVVGMPYPGFPFYKAGIRAGDIVLNIDGENVSGKTMSDISSKLKGAAGTEVSIEYLSSKDKKVHNVKLQREEIVVKDVPYYGFVADSIGYIKLIGFKQNAAKEVRAALDSLNKRGKLKAVILDLRNNGGGLLMQAVKIVNLFVGPGEKIVSTKGKTKSENTIYRTHNKALYPNVGIVVLTNAHSASASEIVAGAFQDLDRAVIMGQKSYGKGLVQKVYPLSYRSQVKITVAKYYIPSGRCIQSLDYQHKDKQGRAFRTPDSLMQTFTTKNGRKVKDGGGIIPDVKLTPRRYSLLASSLMRKYEIFDYATNYVNTKDSIRHLQTFSIDDSTYNDFVHFVQKDSFSYRLPVDISLQKLKLQAAADSLAIINDIEILEQKVAREKLNDYSKYKKGIKALLRQELLSRYYFQSGKIEAALEDDTEIKEAINLLDNRNRYSHLLGQK